jgi:drug/metabolite transporter, DME family
MPRLWLVITACLWSLSGPFAKVLALPGPSMAAYRALFAGCFLMLFVRRGQTSVRPALVAMALCFTGMNFCFLTSMTYTSAANAIFLQCTAPIWSLFACLIWLKEPLDKRSLISVLVGLVGMAWIASGGWSDSPWGISLALMAGVFYGLLTVFLRYLRDENALWLTVVNHLTAGVLLLPALFLPGQVSPAELSLAQFFGLLSFGVIQMGVPYLLYARSLKSVSPQEAGVITLIEPVLNPVFTYVAVSEVPAWSTVFGGAIVLAAVGLRYLKR